MCPRVCRGNPKGLSQRWHLFRRQGQRGSPLKGSMERSTGISWGSHWAILRRGPVVKQPRALESAAAVGLAPRCLLWEDFQPWAAIKICLPLWLSACQPSYLLGPTSPANVARIPFMFHSCTSITLTDCKCRLVACISLCEHHGRAQCGADTACSLYDYKLCYCLNLQNVIF